MWSLNNKIQELTLRMVYEMDCELCNLICLTDTWLKPEATSSADECTWMSTKSISGELWIMHIHKLICTPDYKILTVSFMPFYLPREFWQITIILTFVPGLKHQEAAGSIPESYDTALSGSPDQPVFILRDFNNCDLAHHLSILHQLTVLQDTPKFLIIVWATYQMLIERCAPLHCKTFHCEFTVIYWQQLRQ